MEPMVLKRIDERLASIENRVIEISIMMNPDSFLDKDDVIAIEQTEKEEREGKMITLEELKKKRNEIKRD